MPLSSGKSSELVYNTLDQEQIVSDSSYRGAICGRVANRIENAEFELNQQQYKLATNEGSNILHGGPVGFSHRYWEMSEVCSDEDYQELTLSLMSKDGDQGFPGNMQVDITYILTQANELKIEFNATCDRACPINLCDHSYFDLGADNIHGLCLQINADEFLKVDRNSIPLGKFSKVEHIMDFRQLSALDNKLQQSTFDNCYKLKDGQKLAALLYNPQNKIGLKITTNQVGLQFYSGSIIDGKHRALALEAQGFPNAINSADLPHHIVSPTQPYAKFVTYKFFHASTDMIDNSDE